ncbi:hypothetical protein ORI89_00755 [Sphingobacterium sp. UT-1RO-CII-1]|uniref:hypothetical protein n=1 Tax=Sphingobacterium sp. UT-1RO-CII-1 TaxID=2995225 RepID=UPI00227A93B0|nr:hypothetical protein [Sphingobacterium sp. UT-1RO-CII-1]MCY4778162.1 hypothetical protein [Sphingobacterium sp. UT-1RO-CII-1]
MKLTPLNIVIACFLTWCVSEWGNDDLVLSWWKLALFSLALLISDILLRITIKDVKKLWAAQIGFVLVASILILIIRVVFS